MSNGGPPHVPSEPQMATVNIKLGVADPSGRPRTVIKRTWTGPPAEAVNCTQELEHHITRTLMKFGINALGQEVDAAEAERAVTIYENKKTSEGFLEGASSLSVKD